MLIDPRRIRNCSLFCLENIELIIAAWLLPSPGSREHIGETMIVVSVGFIISFFWIESFSIFCSGITVLFFME